MLAALGSFWVADRAGAGLARCQQHRLDARERTSTGTGEGERVLVIGDSWSVGLGQDDFSRSWPSRLAGEVHVAAGGRLLAADDLGQRRLPAAVGAEQGQDRALGDGEVDAAEHLDPAVRRVQVDHLEDRDAAYRAPPETAGICWVCSTAGMSVSVWSGPASSSSE